MLMQKNWHPRHLRLGGAALNAAQSDPRIKAIMHVSGTNMHWVQSQGMFNAANTQEARKIRRKADAEKRTRQFASQIRERDGGVPQEQPDDASQYNKEYTQYYKRPPRLSSQFSEQQRRHGCNCMDFMGQYASHGAHRGN